MKEFGKEKYYIFEDVENFKSYSHYFTINKEIYEESLKVKKLDRILKLILY